MRFVFEVLVGPLAIASFVSWAVFVGAHEGTALRGDRMWVLGFVIFLALGYQQATIWSLRFRLSDWEKRVEKMLSSRDKSGSWK